MPLRVSHVALRVPDVDASVAYAEAVLGLRLTQRDENAAYLRCSSRHHELALLAGAETACDHIAFEVLDQAGYEERIERVQRAGLMVLDRGALEPGVKDAIRFVGPGGLTIELLYGMAHDQPADYDSIAPRPVKFEHITLKSSQKTELEDILIDVVGLRLSDRAEAATSWLRASDEHHGISIIAAEVDALHHYAWQFADFATFARIGDHLMSRGRTFLWGPGHHGIGDNYFCYALDGDGVVLEYSAGIRRIDNDDSYEAQIWPDVPLSVNRWGNPPPPQEFLQAGTPHVAISDLVN